MFKNVLTSPHPPEKILKYTDLSVHNAGTMKTYNLGAQVYDLSQYAHNFHSIIKEGNI